MIRKTLQALAFLLILALCTLLLFPWHHLANYSLNRMPGVGFMAQDSGWTLQGLQLRDLQASWRGYVLRADSISAGFSPFSLRASVAGALQPAGTLDASIGATGMDARAKIQEFPLDMIFSTLGLPLRGGEAFAVANSEHPASGVAQIHLRILGPIVPDKELRMIVEDLQLDQASASIETAADGSMQVRDITADFNQGSLLGSGTQDVQGNFSYKLRISGDDLVSRLHGLTGVAPDAAAGNLLLEIYTQGGEIHYRRWTP